MSVASIKTGSLEPPMDITVDTLTVGTIVYTTPPTPGPAEDLPFAHIHTNNIAVGSGAAIVRTIPLAPQSGDTSIFQYTTGDDAGSYADNIDFQVSSAFSAIDILTPMVVEVTLSVTMAVDNVPAGTHGFSLVNTDAIGDEAIILAGTSFTSTSAPVTLSTTYRQTVATTGRVGIYLCAHGAAFDGIALNQSVRVRCLARLSEDEVGELTPP